MRIGPLRERIVIQYPTETVASGGQPLKTWSTHTTVWGRPEYLSGRELEAMQKINSDIQIRFTARYLSSVTELMRISWRSEYWNIHAILPDERKEFMFLMASREK